MRQFACISAGLIALSGCATDGFLKTSDPEAFMGGQNGDLRVLINDKCPSGQSAKAAVEALRSSDRSGFDVSGFASIATSIAAQLGTLAFKSFGSFLEESSKDSLTRSTGIGGGFFYTTALGPEKEISVAPQFRCLFLIRDGFQPNSRGFDAQSPADLVTVWTDLGLTKTPDFFAAIHLETAGETDPSSEGRPSSDASDTGQGATNGAARTRTAPAAGGVVFPDDVAAAAAADGGSPAASDEDPAPEDANRSGRTGSFGDKSAPAVTPPYFNAKVDRIFVSEFQNTQHTARTRDLAIVLNFSLASAPTVVGVNGINSGVTVLGNQFAIGAIRLPGAALQDYTARQTSGLQTAWMVMPKAATFDPRATVDVTAYVVEWAPGNQMMQDLGQFMSSADTTASVNAALTGAIDGSTAGTRGREAVESQIAEAGLVRAVRDARRLLQLELDKEGEDFDLGEALSARDALEDSLFAVEKRKSELGWKPSADHQAEITRAQTLLRDPRIL